MVGLCFARGIYIVVRATQCESCPLCTCRTGQAGGVITKSYIEQTNNALVCSLCPQCNARRGYRVPRGDWYLAIRARRARTPRQHGEHRPLGTTALLQQSILANGTTPLLPQNWHQMTGIEARPTKKPSGPKKWGPKPPRLMTTTLKLIVYFCK
jgi:L-lactate utilization protein LutB